MLLDFDHHATTPLDPQVWEAMQPYFGPSYGNPSSSSHRRGLNAAAVETHCRERVANLLRVEPRDVVWDEWSDRGQQPRHPGTSPRSWPTVRDGHIRTEHRSVLDPARRLRRMGWPVTILPVDSKGRVDLGQLARAITPQTKLVSLMWANNEIGTISPLSEISELCHQRGVWLHSDATQTVGKIPVDLQATVVDLLSFSGHKIYGPAGIGVLVVRRDRAPSLFSR